MLVAGASTPLRYDGQYTSTQSGLIYLRARTYDPQTAQFLTVDPALQATGEPYTYTKDNPLNNVDPTGECGEGAAGGKGYDDKYCKDLKEKIAHLATQVGADITEAIKKSEEAIRWFEWAEKVVFGAGRYRRQGEILSESARALRAKAATESREWDQYTKEFDEHCRMYHGSNQGPIWA